MLNLKAPLRGAFKFNSFMYYKINGLIIHKIMINIIIIKDNKNIFQQIFFKILLKLIIKKVIKIF